MFPLHNVLVKEHYKGVEPQDLLLLISIKQNISKAQSCAYGNAPANLTLSDLNLG